MGKHSTFYELADPANKAPHLCLVKFCRKHRAPKRRICYAHHVESWRAKNPDKWAYLSIKTRAKRRRIEFKLTFEEFLSVAESTGYIDDKGIFADDLHLDRIDPLKGYEIGNIRVISCRENSLKGATFDKQAYRELKRKQHEQTQQQATESDDCPF
jgi:hypothetical protein